MKLVNISLTIWLLGIGHHRLRLLPSQVDAQNCWLPEIDVLPGMAKNGKYSVNFVISVKIPVNIEYNIKLPTIINRIYYICYIAYIITLLTSTGT